MASKKAKPNGHYTMSDDYDTIIDMISQLSVRDLPGVGYATGDKLKELLEVETCADLMKISLPRLQELFGAKTGQNLHDACRGIDRDKLKFDQATSRKSLSVDVNYGIRFTEQTEVEKFVYEIADEVSRRLKEISAKCSSLTLKLRIRSKDAPIVPNKFLGTGLCDHTSRSTVLRTRTDDSKVIGASCVTMLRTMKFLVCDLRGIGIGMSKLSYETLSPQKMMLEDYFKSNQSLQKDNPGVRSTQSAVINGSAVSSMFNDNEPAISHAGHSSHHSSMAVSRETIDESVLNELPEELRQEIMKSYGITKESKVT
ncbi:DNA repair protein REV1 [Halotydeus destructor]|nr:DNA repair protein REV1 [Halotydeus destructor]